MNKYYDFKRKNNRNGLLLLIFLSYLCKSYAFIDTGSGGGEIPPTEIPWEKCLSNSAISFNATPSTIGLGESSTISWAIRPPVGCNLFSRTILNGIGYGLNGSVVVRPTYTTQYPLTLIVPGGFKNLGSVTVNVSVAPRKKLSTITREMADAIVASRSQLVTALQSGKKIIWIENSAQIDLLERISDHRETPPDYALHIPSGVTLASGHSGTNPGGLLYVQKWNPKKPHMIDMGEGSRITGLRILGPNSSAERKEDNRTGIVVRNKAYVTIDHNEIYNWPDAAINVRDPLNNRNFPETIFITENYIHHNLQCGKGYGVVIRGGYMLVEKNLFNFNRHAITGDGSAGSGYIASNNLILSGGHTCKKKSYYLPYFDQHFDMHGTGSADHRGSSAGEYIDINNNTIRGEQNYKVIMTRPAFYLRGQPTEKAYFRNNVVAHDNQKEAVRKEDNTTNLVVTNNRYDKDTSFSLAVGDFDGDGFDDIFQATGTLWVYSARGQSEWKILNISTKLLPELRFGDFDGNGKTDILTQQGDRWLVANNATESWRALPIKASIPLSKLRLGDFNGDGKTDLFMTHNGEWFYSSAGEFYWQSLQTSGIQLENLRLGDFNGDGRTDVFSFANNAWSVSYGGQSKWIRINSKIGDNINQLVFGDFNGDGRTDVARRAFDYFPLPRYIWQVSWSGIYPWTTLKKDTANWPLTSMQLGDFNGDGRADLLDYGKTYVSNRRVVIGNKFTMFPGGKTSMANWSRHDMR